MINKFSIKYLNYRLHQLFYFQQLNLELIELIFVELHPAIYGKNNLKKIIQILNNHNFKIVENLNNNFFSKNF